MATTTTASFLALLEKSQLLSPKDLEKVRAASGKYGDAKALAKALITAKGLTRWQAGQLLAGRSSFTLGKFRLIDLLGRGGMGSVFLAEHKTMGRRVALKIISKQTGRDPEQLERFLQEARRIAALDHPNIVRAFDVDHEGERYFLVLEYIEGRNLQQIVESDGPMDVARAARYVRQAALGLAHAHDRKMIHCDIKPANLIVSDGDTVKILDMGMARLVESDGSSSDSNENIVGTIDYIAPEQAMEAEDLDHRADIYSLGCTLYFLLTSRPPFGEGTLAQRIMKHQTQAPPPIADIRSGVPDDLAAVCMKMMAKKPDERFQTAAEVAQSLERWEVGGAPVVPLQAEPTVPNEPAVVELIDDDDAPKAKVDGDVSIKVVDTGSFSGRAGSSRGRRSAGVKQTTEKEPAIADSTGFFADPRKKWATIIVGSLVLLGAIGGGIAWMLSGGDQVASNTGAESAATAPAEPQASTKTPIEVPDGGLDLDAGLDDLEGAFGGDKSDAAPKTSPVDESKSPSEPEKSSAKTAEAGNAGAGTSGAEMSIDKKGEPAPPPKDAAQPAAGEEKKKPEETTPEKEGAKAPTDEKKEAAENKPNGAKAEKEPAKKPAKAEPFKDFPKAVDLPILNDNDPAGQASKASLVLGKIHGAADINWQMLLVGGDKVVKGGRKYVLARTEQDAAKASWSVQLAGDSSGEQLNVARLSRNGENLNFQWAEDAAGASANYLRNCLLQIRVGGDSRYTALTKPIHAEPIVLDLLRGQSNASVDIKWIPDDELIRFKFSKIEGFEKASFEPADPVAPKTQVALNFVYTDAHQNDNNAVTFRILPTSRKTSLSLDLRLVNPLPRAFQSVVGNYNEQQLGVMVDRMGNQRSELQRKKDRLKGEEANKTLREIDTLSGQMWYLNFFLKAHKKASLHYQVVADLGGQEVVLVTTN